MKVFSVFWISYFGLQILAVDAGKVVSKTRVNLLVSRIENEVKTLRADVDLFQYDLMDVRGMIIEFNESCCYGDKCVSFAGEEDNNFQESVSKSKQALPVPDHVTRLMKAFSSEKEFYRENFGALQDFRQNFSSKLDELAAEKGVLFETLKEEIERTDNFVEKTEHDLAHCQTQNDLIKAGILNLEIDLATLNGDILNRIEKIDAETAGQRKSIELLQSLTDNLETKLGLIGVSLQDLSDKVNKNDKLAKECDGSWKISHVLNSCFLFQSKHRSWRDASSFCTARGARLVEITNRQKSEQVKRLFEETNLSLHWGGGTYDSFWTGGSRDAGVWKWEESKSRVAWRNWYPGEPSSGQDCIAVMINDRSFRWDNQECWMVNEFVCEKIIH